MTKPTTTQSDKQHGHQRDQVSVRWVISVGIGLLGLIGMTLVVLGLLLKVNLPDKALVEAGAEWERTERAPGVEPNQEYDRIAYERMMRQRLSRYQWRNREHTVARIPIDRSIEILAKRKLEVRWPEARKKETFDE